MSAQRSSVPAPLIASIGGLVAVIGGIAATIAVGATAPMLLGVLIGVGVLLLVVMGVLIGIGRKNRPR